MLEALTVSQAVVVALLNESDLEIPVTVSLAPALCRVLADWLLGLAGVD